MGKMGAMLGFNVDRLIQDSCECCAPDTFFSVPFFQDFEVLVQWSCCVLSIQKENKHVFFLIYLQSKVFNLEVVGEVYSTQKLLDEWHFGCTDFQGLGGSSQLGIG